MPSALTSVPDGVLRRLHDDLAAGVLRTPLTQAALQSRGAGLHSTDILEVLGSLDDVAIQAIVAAVRAERSAFKPPDLRLVWTGPSPRGTTARSTAVVVRELFASARESVLVGGYRFDYGSDLFEPLHGVMKVHGVAASVFMDIDGTAGTSDAAPAYAAQAVAKFHEANWPFGEPFPTLWYDPRTACPGPPWVSLHAKCIVVDRRRTLMTSANFTERGQQRNLEAGALIEDATFAGSLCDQWQRLIEAGVMLRGE